MKKLLIVVSIISVLNFVGCGSGSKGIMTGDECEAPGLEWMEAVEGYDKQEVIELATKFEAAAKADAEKISENSDAKSGFSITASLNEIVHNSSGRTVKVSQTFYEKANTYRATICNIERWLKNETLSDPSVRLRAQNLLLDLSDNFNTIISNEKNVTNVVSINQKGGITAGTVNIGTPARILDQNIILQLNNLLRDHKNQLIDVTAVLGDQEAYQFAKQIDDHLSKNGFKTSGVNQSVFSEPVRGQIIDLESDPIRIIIGGRE